MISEDFLRRLGLDPEQIGAVMAAHEAETRLRSACVAEGISLPVAEKIVCFVSADDVPEDPELLQLLVRETWGDLASKHKH